MAQLDANAEWSFRFAVRCGSISSHFGNGNTTAVMRDNVRAKLALLGTVTRLEAEAVDELLSDALVGVATLRPSAERSDDALGRAILDGANGHRGSAAAFYAPYTVTDSMLLRFLTQPSGGTPANAVFDLVRAPVPIARAGAGTGPVTSRYTAGRVAGGVAGATNADTGEALATTAVRNGLIPTWVIVGGVAVAAVVAIGVVGYALRPVADLAEEL